MCKHSTNTLQTAITLYKQKRNYTQHYTFFHKIENLCNSDKPIHNYTQLYITAQYFTTIQSYTTLANTIHYYTLALQHSTTLYTTIRNSVNTFRNSTIRYTTFFLQHFTKLYQTKLYVTLQRKRSNTLQTLYKHFAILSQISTQLDKTSQYFTSLYTTLFNLSTICTSLHNFTQLYRFATFSRHYNTLHTLAPLLLDFTMIDNILQTTTQHINTSQDFSQLRTTSIFFEDCTTLFTQL